MTAEVQDLSQPEAIWQAVLELLRLEMPSDQFGSFLNLSVGQSWTGHSFTVLVPTPFSISWLELPLHYLMATEALEQVTGQKAAIDYQVATNLAEPETSTLTSEPTPTLTSGKTSAWRCPDHPERTPRASVHAPGQMHCTHKDRNSNTYCNLTSKT